MAKYVGKRIVPLPCGEWVQTKEYEMLSVVLYKATGDSYMAKRQVPAGTAITDTAFWAKSSDYSQQLQNVSDQLTETLRLVRADNDATEAAIKRDNTATTQTVNESNAETKQHVDESLAETTEDLTGKVNTAVSAMNQSKSQFDTTSAALTARMNSIVGGATTDTEILDARVDADDVEHTNLGERLRAIDRQLNDAASETLDETRRNSLAEYIREEWRKDCNLLRGSELHKGHVDISTLHSGDSMEEAVDPNGEGYYLFVNASELHKAGLNILFMGDLRPRAIMRGRYGGSEDDWRYGGYLQYPYQPHFFDLENGGKVLNTAGSGWNHIVAHYLYINLTEEQLSSNKISICDAEGTPILNNLTELLDRVEAYEDRRDEQRSGVTLETVNAKIDTVKTELQNETDEKIEEALNGQASFWKGKTINFIGDSITYGAYTPVGGGSHQRAEKRYCEVACEILGATCRNYGASGTSISSTTYQSPTAAFSRRYATMANDADMVVVVGGTNDYGTNVVLGTIADTEDVSFYGALNVLCNGLLEKYPGKRIVFITPFHRANEGANSAGATLAQYRQAIFDVARDVYGFAVLDGWAVGLSPKNAAIKAQYIVDGLHPNPPGHELIGQSVAHMLNAL